MNEDMLQVLKTILPKIFALEKVIKDSKFGDDYEQYLTYYTTLVDEQIGGALLGFLSAPEE